MSLGGLLKKIISFFLSYYVYFLPSLGEAKLHQYNVSCWRTIKKTMLIPRQEFQSRSKEIRKEYS